MRRARVEASIPAIGRALLVLVLLVGGCGTNSGAHMTQVQAGPGDVPAVILEAEPRYLLGFPMVVAVTYDNSGSATQFLRLPELTYWTNKGRFAINFEPVGQGVPLEAKANPPRPEAPGMVLEPGEAVRMPMDLSNVVTGLK